MPMNLSSRAALAAGLIGLVVIVSALVLQHGFGYAPCPLCLEQRWPYYIGVPIAFILAFTGDRLPAKAMAAALLLLAILFAYGCGLGIYQAGAEWEYWLGPANCAAGNIGANPADVGGLFDAIDSSTVVSCTNPSLRILGLSLAGWNAIVMAVMVLITLKGALSAARSR
ncbi:disulfide bond formation protein B [Labrys sp. LIt4]|uniref:Disulfide bond formation protein B n=1 Tax=Labrys okinawensis TaxID=346911 RepID=A0A2S9QH90_9HYPH|nr:MULTISPECIES: disulfide bond formation protein B [Labrys]MBP0579624.1 disulfide bond formation protein B [Labrys sp. LIt4]PRH88721.1 disulfide bond formation protein B [Labrys okinawensis]